MRSPFAKIDGQLASTDAISLSVKVVRAMTLETDHPIRPQLMIWGTVAPNLGFSNIAREVLIDAGLDQSIPAYSITMACSTSMAGAMNAASLLVKQGEGLALVGGVECMSRTQIGLSQSLSDWLRQFFEARSLNKKLSSFTELNFRDVRLHIPSITNRTTGLSMGEHCELTAKEWQIKREDQDALALASHENAIAAQDNGFFDDLVISMDNLDHDAIPRRATNLEKLAKLNPVFDRTSGKGTLTAGNSSPLTDGASSVWVVHENTLGTLANNIARVRMLDWEFAAVDIQQEGLLMAPSYAIPRLLHRHGLNYDDINLWEIHEAFAAQVLYNVAALENREFLKEKVGLEIDFGTFPWDRLNPNGGSVAIGHPFGATGARDLSQATKELAAMPLGSRAIVSICADGGLGTVALLEAA
ncbi:MAG: acetyl-CoA C-acyltransferase [Gammaproteobacteria bacterium]